MKKSTFALLGISCSLLAASDSCAPTPPTTCYEENCRTCYCLGPENYLANAPVCPRTCGGDFTIEVAALYWKADQDGMEYAVENQVQIPSQNSSIGQVNNLVDAEYKTPKFEYNWGFRLGLGYCTTCDGWDIGVSWTRFKGKGNSCDEAEGEENISLLPLWSAFNSLNGRILYANEINTHFNLQIDSVQIELGRDFWVSRYLSFRPHVGISIAKLDQNFTIIHKGGSWEAIDDGIAFTPPSTCTQ